MSDSPTNSAPVQHTQEPLNATILLVDDEKNILSSLKRVLHRHVSTILIAESGAQGLALLKEHSVDLVISDMRMPEMDGAEFLTYVAELYPDTKRFLLTGYADMESAIRAVNEGQIERFLQKPWQEDKLVTLVRRVLTDQKLREENDNLKAVNQKQLEKLELLNSSLEEKIKLRTQYLEAATKKLAESHAQIKNSLNDTTSIFIKLIEQQEQKDSYIKKAIVLVDKMALQLNLSEQEANALNLAMLLCRVGHLSLPEPLRQKAFVNLDKKEREQLEQSPILTEQLFSEMKQLKSAAEIVRHYRERVDGEGYPGRLSGDAIPFGSRLLSIIIDYFELQLGHIVDDKLTCIEAKKYLIANKNSKYDSHIVETFSELLNTSDADLFTPEIKVAPAGLSTGMCTARDIISPSGALLIPANTLLETAMIEGLQTLIHKYGEDFIIYIRVRS